MDVSHRPALLAAVQNPFARQIGYSHDGLEVCGFPTVILGGLTLKCVPVVLEVGGRELLGFSPPESIGIPIGLNALFCNTRGEPIAEIVANEWRAYAHDWDVETVGLRTTIRTGYRDVSLILRVEPPGKIVVERIRMYYKRAPSRSPEGSH